MRRLGWVVVAALAAAWAGCQAIGVLDRDLSEEELSRFHRVVGVDLPRGRMTYDCGPEALAAVLHYWGHPIPVDEISGEIYDRERKGTISTELAPCARRLGFRAHYADGTVGRIKEAIDRGVPPIIMVKVQKDLFHFFVVVGYDDAEAEILVREYETGYRKIRYAHLELLWDPAGHYYLEVTRGDADSDFVRGAELEQDGRFAQALEWYRRALQKEPDHQPAHLGAGNCFIALGQRARALGHLSKAVELAPDDPRALNNLAHLLWDERQDLSRARTLSEQAVQRYQDRLQTLRAQLDPIRGEDVQAEVRQKVHRYELELALALGTLGSIRGDQGEYALAISAWKTSYDLLPLTLFDLRARRLHSIAQAYRELGIHTQCRTYLEHALRVAEDEALRQRIQEDLSKLPE